MAFEQYRQTVILLAKFGFSAKQVWAMPILEAFAWVESYLQSVGVKQPLARRDDPNVTHYVFKRRNKSENNVKGR